MRYGGLTPLTSQTVYGFKVHSTGPLPKSFFVIVFNIGSIKVTGGSLLFFFFIHEPNTNQIFYTCVTCLLNLEVTTLHLKGRYGPYLFFV